MFFLKILGIKSLFKYFNLDLSNLEDFTYLFKFSKIYRMTPSILNIKDTQFTNVNHKWETIWIWHIEQSQAIWLQTKLI